MRIVLTSSRLVQVGVVLVSMALAGCVSFTPATQSTVELQDRPYVALLPFAFDIEITELSYVKTVEGALSPEEESIQLAEALQEIRNEARWLLLSRLATGQGFRIVPLEQTDALVEELQLKPGVLPNAEQLTAFRHRLGADLVVAGSILDYGKIRWQWAAAGMLTDMTVETMIVGVASGWNPAIILGVVVGWDLLTSPPLWFGGAYVFGVAFRPVRVEARAFETIQGYPIWQSMEESAYAWGALKQLPERVRAKKEAQLQLNLADVMESLGDSLTEQAWTTSQLRGQGSTQH